MKLIASLVLLLFLSSVSIGQRVKLSGTVYDPNGDVVVAAMINTRHARGQQSTSKSNDEGKFEIELQPGLYALEL